ncbi:hypothetical protein B0H11DRAFT_2259378 [Mycena galericulata]|nr:hypothetical protein B0H11DRAFT_2259378 [Mycena galericulata]
MSGPRFEGIGRTGPQVRSLPSSYTNPFAEPALRVVTRAPAFPTAGFTTRPPALARVPHPAPSAKIRLPRTPRHRLPRDPDSEPPPQSKSILASSLAQAARSSTSLLNAFHARPVAHPHEFAVSVHAACAGGAAADWLIARSRLCIRVPVRTSASPPRDDVFHSTREEAF